MTIFKMLERRGLALGSADLLVCVSKQVDLDVCVWGCFVLARHL